VAKRSDVVALEKNY